MTEIDWSASGRRPAIVLTAADHQRLVTLMETATLDPTIAHFLHEELARADIIPEGAVGSVTMGSVDRTPF